MGASTKGLSGFNLDMARFIPASKRLGFKPFFYVVETKREEEFIRELTALIEEQYPALSLLSQQEEKELALKTWESYAYITDKSTTSFLAYEVSRTSGVHLKITASDICCFQPFKDFSSSLPSTRVVREHKTFLEPAEALLSIVANYSCPGYRKEKSTISINGVTYTADENVYLPNPISIEVKRGILFRQNNCVSLSDAYLYIPGRLESNFPKKEL